MSQVATNSFQAWVLASRPKTLGAISCPVILGSALAYAHGAFLPGVMILTLVCSLFLQILANIINDYGDFLKGADTHERLGPPRAMQMGWITKTSMQNGIGILLLLIILLGLILVFRGGMPILLIGIASILLCIWYTLGPKPLAYLGFSEAMILFFFGPLPVFGAYYLQTLSFTPCLFAVSIAPALLSTALIMTNNLRDMKEDQKNKKYTIAVRFGDRFSRISIVCLVLGALISPLVLILFYNYSWWILGAAISLIPALKRLPIIITEPISARFNLLFVGFGQSLYGLSILLSVGLIYGSP